MAEQSQARRSYQDSCRRLQQDGGLAAGESPPIPPQRPSYDDPEPLGIRFFRTRVTGDFSNLTLPRTFFGRSEVAAASFRNGDLSESTLCWNDFIGVDFSGCSLRSSDLRAAIFNGVNFARCDLRGVDFRHSRFDGCDFTDADLRGIKLTRSHGEKIKLSLQQKEGVHGRIAMAKNPAAGSMRFIGGAKYRRQPERFLTPR